MKRLSALFLVAALLAGCATMGGPAPEFQTEIQVQGDPAIAALEISPIWETTLFGSGIGFFKLTVKNTTGKVIKVVWEKSSISYNSKFYTPFLTGQKFIEAETPMSPSVIPVSGVMTKEMRASGQVYYVSGQYGGWRTQPIQATSLQIVICVESGDIENFYTATINQL